MTLLANFRSVWHVQVKHGYDGGGLLGRHIFLFKFEKSGREGAREARGEGCRSRCGVDERNGTDGGGSGLRWLEVERGRTTALVAGTGAQSSLNR